MKYPSTFLAVLLALLLAGCASNKPKIEVPTPVETGTAPIPKSGYVAATTNWPEHFSPAGTECSWGQCSWGQV
jgi:uncharacterized lipoprotein YbaY